MNNSRFLSFAAGLAILVGSSVLAAEKEYFGAGNGTAESPYWIETVEHLKNVSLFPNAYFIQTKDIDAGDCKFKPICDFNSPFSGHYDGEGHRITINELGSIEGSIALAGIWGFANGAEIKNLNVDVNASLNLKGRACVGGVVACANNTDIRNCSISSDSKIEATSEKCLYAGGIVGYSAFGSSVKSCSFDGRITGCSNGDIDAVCAVGGIVGENRTGSTISKSTFAETGAVYGSSLIAPAWIGGIAGFNEDFTYVCNCHAVVPQNLKPDFAGQKRVATEIKKCNSAGCVSGYSNERVAVGGIAGFNVGNINSCVAQASSLTKGTILKCADSPSALIGGIVGDNGGRVYNVSALSTIQTMSDGFIGVGGVAGRNNGIMDGCKYFAVSGKGLSNFTSLRSFNVFAALCSVSARGGIVGINDNSKNTASITNCKVLGNSDSKLISTYGYARGSYGEIAGMQIEGK